MRDDYTDFKSDVMLVPAVRTTDSTPIWIDLQGFGSATIELVLGVGGIPFDDSNKIEFKLSESDNSDGSSSNLVAAADILGGAGSAGLLKALVAAHAAAAAYKFGYRGSKRYLGLLADFTGTHGVGTPMSAVCRKGRPRNSPPS